MQTNSFSISTMNIQDLEEIKDILEKDFDDFWNYTIFKSELKNSNSKYFVLRKENEIIGFVGILIVIDVADITNIVVKKSYRGNGYSKMLIQYIIDFCKSNNISIINLEVSSENVTAINLYKNFGFVQVGLRKKYYNNSDALLFTYFINDAKRF